MKKIIIASVLGVAGSVATSYGQGIIQFGNYLSQSYSLVTYAGGQNVSTANVQLNLLYALGTYADVNSFLAAAAVVGSTTIDTALNTDGAYGNGAGGFYSDPDTITLAGWTVGATATFMIQAWDTTTGASYAAAGISGQSALWTEVVDSQYAINQTVSGYGIVPTTVGVPEAMVFGSGVTLVAVPEPSTLALAGLGGFGMLMALRRKKA